MEANPIGIHAAVVSLELGGVYQITATTPTDTLIGAPPGDSGADGNFLRQSGRCLAAQGGKHGRRKTGRQKK